MRGLQNKVVIIAGAASGLGAATAARLAEEGAKVVVGGRTLAGAEKTAGAIGESGGTAIGIEFDISDDSSVKALVDAAVAEFGGLDAVHVNAADMVALQSDTDVVDIELDVWDRIVEVNLRGHMLVTRHSVPRLLERGGGAIVYTSSIAAHAGEPARPAYAVTKAGINALARHVASRWGKEGIRANAITPGPILTDAMRNEYPERMLAGMLKQTRSTRLGDATDVAAMVAFLVSDDGAWINGQTVNVDGGIVLR
ncbi:SDR family oxidoreductase [Aldersonia sp. NBC_00410]|uniref:SDR family NAD(P)-dependent oxidoreductase n=1 Tax=Aldersonia sp. NBC_00410 TaxID=2975954 RepID=UPI0022509910|nr:SDR family oxidoreductase [Aldersonia sp. NBC_00410]MCX5044198.1 SDR family oxidoreductase [Aldersonia sp. NBC_00410]